MKVPSADMKTTSADRVCVRVKQLRQPVRSTRILVPTLCSQLRLENDKKKKIKFVPVKSNRHVFLFFVALRYWRVNALLRVGWSVE